MPEPPHRGDQAQRTVGVGFGDGPAVGGIAEPINKIQLLLPWMTFATLILLTIGIVVFRRVRK